jgi:hypothetical protein
MAGSCAAGCVVGNSYGNGSVESVRLERKAIGIRGSAVKTTMPFQQENTGAGESVCIAR